MFSSKKKLNQEIDNLKQEIENLKIDKDVEHDIRLVAESEMRTAKINHRLCVNKINELEADIANRMRYTAELEGMVTELDEENDRLAGIVGEYQQELARNTEKLKTAILKNEELEKKIQKYYEYERQFRKKIKDLTEENKSLQIQNLLLKAICKD